MFAEIQLQNLSYHDVRKHYYDIKTRVKIKRIRVIYTGQVINAKVKQYGRKTKHCLNNKGRFPINTTMSSSEIINISFKF